MKARYPVAVLSLSAAAIVSLWSEEGWMETAAVPTKNDRCTNGFGSTFKEDGSEVLCGEKIDPVRAAKRSLIHITKDETKLKQCIKGEMTKDEYDRILNFSYQYGTDATCKSSMVKHINAGQYAKACEAYLLYKYSGGFDCSTPNNKVCSGVWKRSLERKESCMAEQAEIAAQSLPPAILQSAPVSKRKWWAFWR